MFRLKEQRSVLANSSAISGAAPPGGLDAHELAGRGLHALGDLADLRLRDPGHRAGHRDRGPGDTGAVQDRHRHGRQAWLILADRVRVAALTRLGQAAEELLSGPDA